MLWSFQPGVLAWLIVLETLYVRAVRILRRRGVDIPGTQVACWHTGIALQAIALLSPIGAYADELLSAHMVEHLLLADIGAPLLVLGMRTPVLQFLLPRPVLVTLARRRRLRAVFARLRQPLVAVPTYILVLYAWHLGPLFEAAVRNPFVHALQHASFVAIGILVWWSALEPNHRRIHGELWKIVYILGARLAGMMIAVAFMVIRTPIYTGVYDPVRRPLGLSAIADQRTAGGIMMSVDIVLMMAALAYFFWRASEDDREANPPTVLAGGGPPAAPTTGR